MLIRCRIRNQIWDLCLVSPTGVISPISRRDAYYSGFPGSCSHSGPFFYLQVGEERSSMQEARPFRLDLKPKPTVSLSLPRTCRKIYEETNDLFWAKNTFYFPTPHRLISTFKFMGKYPPRRITSLLLATTPWVGNDLSWLDTALQLLISQGKSSSLQRLDILVHKDVIHIMSDAKMQRLSFLQECWAYKFISCLKQARRLRGVEKKLAVTYPGEVTAILPKEWEGALWKVQEAWRSKAYWGSTMLFEDMRAPLGKESPSGGLIQRNHGPGDIGMGLLD